MRKEVLGWVFNGATRCIELATKKVETILAELKTMLRMGCDVLFKQIQKLVGKLRHASIGIPSGRYLFGPMNRPMALEPKLVFWNCCPAAQ